MESDEIRVMALLIGIFISVHVLGLLTGYKYLHLISIGQAEPALGQPGNILNSVYILAYLLVMTLLIFLIVKFKKKILTVIEALAIFFASDIVFELLIPIGIPIPNIGTVSIGPFLALGLTYYHLRNPTYLSQNLALIFAVSGAGAVLGASLGVLPVLVLIIALGIYDFISVFYTKHMVYLAKAITERPRAFTAALPTSKRMKDPEIKEKAKEREVEKKEIEKDKSPSGHTFQLGGGDIAIPLMLSVSILRIGVVNAIAASVGALIALIILFAYILKRPGIALPALPPVSAGAVIGFLVSILIL